jgi:hypothetical protein
MDYFALRKTPRRSDMARAYRVESGGRNLFYRYRRQ